MPLNDAQVLFYENYFKKYKTNKQGSKPTVKQHDNHGIAPWSCFLQQCLCIPRGSAGEQ